MLTHIVLFKLKDRWPEDTQRLGARLKSRRGQIPPVRPIELGVTGVESARAYDLGLIAHFDSRVARKEYQAHPCPVVNRAAVDYLRPGR